MKAMHRRLAAAAVTLLPLACLAATDAESIDRAIRNLDSCAKETVLLFAASANGDAMASYVRVQREEIAKLVETAAKPLDEAGGQARVTKAKALADTLRAALAKEDAHAAQAAAQGLHELARGGK